MFASIYTPTNDDEVCLFPYLLSIQCIQALTGELENVSLASKRNGDEGLVSCSSFLLFSFLLFITEV